MPQTIEDLGKLVKSKYPSYSDLTDEAVGRMVKSKHPEYSQFVDPADAKLAHIQDIIDSRNKYMHEHMLAPDLEHVRDLTPPGVLPIKGMELPLLMPGAPVPAGGSAMAMAIPAAVSMGAGYGVERGLRHLGVPGSLAIPAGMAAGALAGGPVTRGIASTFPGVLPDALGPTTTGILDALPGKLGYRINKMLNPVETAPLPAHVLDPYNNPPPMSPAAGGWVNPQPQPLTPHERPAPINVGTSWAKDFMAEMDKVPSVASSSDTGLYSPHQSDPYVNKQPLTHMIDPLPVLPSQTLPRTGRGSLMDYDAPPITRKSPPPAVSPGGSAPLSTPPATQPIEGDAAMIGKGEQLAPIDKFEMNRLVHARAQELELPGSPAGKNGHPQLSTAAQENFAAKSWSDLNVKQMRQVYEFMEQKGRLPKKGELPKL